MHKSDNQHHRPELLCPAGNMQKLQIAALNGADAVYLAGPHFSLRKAADNFTLAQLPRAIDWAHEHGVKVHITVNIFPQISDIASLKNYLTTLQKYAPDALIISDPGIMVAAREYTDIDIHVSTQASVCNSKAAVFFQSLGAKRVVVAREVTLAELSEIITACPELEFEMFAHGAMCSSFSGRCVISNFTHGRDSNRGGCIQSCRFPYEVHGEGAPRHLHPLNSKDLFTLDIMPHILASGVHSLKIEGRMKSTLYLAAVTRAYREAIDTGSVSSHARQCVEDLSNRQYTTASMLARAGAESVNNAWEGYSRGADLIGVVIHSNEVYDFIQLKNTLSCGDTVEFIHPAYPQGRTVAVEQIFSYALAPLSVAHASSVVAIKSQGVSLLHAVIRRPFTNQSQAA